MPGMDLRRFLFPVVSLDDEGRPQKLCGHAFAASRDGSLVTCRHVVDVAASAKIGVLDTRHGAVHGIDKVLLSDDGTLDLALLPGFGELVGDQLPLLLPVTLLKVGSDVFTGSHFAPSGWVSGMQSGVFKGHVVGVRDGRHAAMNLSYAAIEGMSGAPVLSWTNASESIGATVAGICFGSESLRVLASEVLEVQVAGDTYRETVNRVVEFGLAYRADTLEAFMRSLDVDPALP
jgi:hypothetical protein